MFSVVVLGITNIGGTNWKEKGGMTWANWGGTQGLLVKTRRIVVGGGEFLEEQMDLPLQIYLVDMEAHCWFDWLE